MVAHEEGIPGKGLQRLLEIKDSDIRISTLRQGNSAVDRGIHMGGAFSAIVPMVSVFYGGFMNLDVAHPSRIGQDMFVLSKGHAVAALASIYADLGYFAPTVLENSRSVESILNGHPGPVLPGVQVATGPLGQGLAVAHGFAMAGKNPPVFNVFCVTGDGELQEGIVWETIMHAPQKRLDNLCLLVDKNEGQLDDSTKLVFSMADLPRQIESFGWRVFNIDGTSYGAVVDALERFVRYPRDGRPTAIVCNTTKGFGAFGAGFNKHKVTLNDQIFGPEMALHAARRAERVDEFLRYRRVLADAGHDVAVAEIDSAAARMDLSIDSAAGTVVTRAPDVRSGRVPARDKTISYDPEALPRYAMSDEVAASDVVNACMQIFARDRRVLSVDSDLGSTSGLYGGVGRIDQHRAINVGIAEANMMCVGEAFAALGYNAWVSTFCPFFDWKVMRRIGVGSQEREETISGESGWLSAGHGIDLTFLATAPNLETQVNGATHMGNDDVTVFGGTAGLKIIDVSCPNQLVSVMRWIMSGNKGLVYLRIMRAPSRVLYEPAVPFVYGQAVRLHGKPDSSVNLVSSGRGVHEIAAAATLLEAAGISTAVYDMPSFDAKTMATLLDSGSLIAAAEQNNGMLWNELGRMVLREHPSADLERVVAINTTRDDGSFQFIHSATYAQLLSRFGLLPEQIASRIRGVLGR